MTGALGGGLAERVRAWVADDPDPATAAEVAALLDAAERGDALAAADLADRFAGLLAFGTAGLRGRLGGGPNRMNRAVVIRAAAGLSAFLADALGLGASARVVVGYDARHGSRRFALDTAAVVAAAGGEALLLPRALPTPVLAFAVRHLDADAGVMVTASHNPASDNGYKVYLGGRVEPGAGRGCQLVPPADAAIAAAMAAVGAVSEIRRADTWGVVGEELVDAYVARAAGASDAAAGSSARRLRIVLTAMHGVGGAIARRVLAAAGLADVHVVAAQAEPDPDFPTVAYPNPEEPGALDLALALAREVGADLVLALDPDADRCAAAVPEAGGWRALTGDEVGALLGEAAARAAAGSAGAVLASSVVSSSLLGRIAAAHGLEHVTTLTGFKWIARVPGLVFGYEEALGYCVDPEAVRDKDGIAAAARLALLADARAAAGSSLLDALDELALAHGLHATGAVAVRFDDAARPGAVTAALRARPPSSFGGSPVVEAVDLAEGRGLPPTDALLYRTAAGGRVIIRPSGTEPKVKCYLEVVVPVGAGSVAGEARPAGVEAGTAVAQARATATARLDALARDLSTLAGRVAAGR